MAPACQPQRQGDAHRERDEDKGDDSQNPTGGSSRGRDRGGEAHGLSSRPQSPCMVTEAVSLLFGACGAVPVRHGAEVCHPLPDQGCEGHDGNHNLR